MYHVHCKFSLSLLFIMISLCGNFIRASYGPVPQTMEWDSSPSCAAKAYHNAHATLNSFTEKAYDNDCCTDTVGLHTMGIAMPSTVGTLLLVETTGAILLGTLTTLAPPVWCCIVSCALGSSAFCCFACSLTAISEKLRRKNARSPNGQLRRHIWQQLVNQHASDNGTLAKLEAGDDINEYASLALLQDAASYSSNSKKRKLEQDKQTVTNLLEITQQKEDYFRAIQNKPHTQYSFDRLGGNNFEELAAVNELSAETLQALHQVWPTQEALRADSKDPSSLNFYLKARIDNPRRNMIFQINNLGSISHRAYTTHPFFKVGSKCKNNHMKIYRVIAYFLDQHNKTRTKKVKPNERELSLDEIETLINALPLEIVEHIIDAIPPDNEFFTTGVPSFLVNVLSPQSRKNWILGNLEGQPFEKVPTEYRVPKQLRAHFTTNRCSEQPKALGL